MTGKQYDKTHPNTMNTNTKHTPLPWKVMLGFIVGPEDQAIASLYTTSLPPLQGEANADLIVHSVNTLPIVTAQRDALLAACKGLVSCLTVREHGEAMQRAFDAITQAEKGQA